jgi:hypothetical protein
MSATAAADRAFDVTEAAVVARLVSAAAVEPAVVGDTGDTGPTLPLALLGGGRIGDELDSGAWVHSTSTPQ